MFADSGKRAFSAILQESVSLNPRLRTVSHGRVSPDLHRMIGIDSKLRAGVRHPNSATEYIAGMEAMPLCCRDLRVDVHNALDRAGTPLTMVALLQACGQIQPASCKNYVQ